MLKAVKFGIVSREEDCQTWQKWNEIGTWQKSGFKASNRLSFLRFRPWLVFKNEGNAEST